MSIWYKITRKKSLPDLMINDDPSSESPIPTDNRKNRWDTFDLLNVGISATLGIGVYMIIGHVVRDLAGPSAIISIIVAATAAFLSGLCYAEFASILSRITSSSFTYVYMSIGHMVAFIVGWNLLLEYIIGAAIVAKGVGLHLDALLNDTLKTTFTNIAPIHWLAFSSYYDFFAFGLVIAMGLAVVCGLKKPFIINNLITLIGIAFVLFIIITGSFQASSSNWNLISDSGTNPYDVGGFFAFGWQGMLKGAALFFAGFIGFDCISSAKLMVSNPKKTYPMAITMSLFILFIAFIGTTTVITLMIPYYEQNVDTVLPHAFRYVGYSVAMYAVAIGGIISLLASLLCFSRQIPFILLSLIHNKLMVTERSSSDEKPFVGKIYIIAAFILCGIFAGLFNANQLINLLSIGTLLTFTLVNLSLILFRYSNRDDNKSIEQKQIYDDDFNWISFVVQTFNFKWKHTPSRMSTIVVKLWLSIFIIATIIFVCTLAFAIDELLNHITWTMVMVQVSAVFIVISILGIAVQPYQHRVGGFTLKLVPILPAISVIINLYLICCLEPTTWIRLGVWILIGLPIYLFAICRNQTVGVKNTSVIMTLEHSQTSSSQINDMKVNIERNISPDNNHIEPNDLSNGVDRVPSIPDQYNDPTNENIHNEKINTEIIALYERRFNEPTNTIESNKLDDGITTASRSRSSTLSLTENIDKPHGSKKTMAPLPPKLTNNRSTDEIKFQQSTNLKEMIHTKQGDTNENFQSLSKGKSSLDEIVSASDAIHTMLEKKEPNGNSYFIEDDKSKRGKNSSLSSVSTSPISTMERNNHQQSPLNGNSSIDDEPQPDTVLQLLDNVLQTEDSGTNTPLNGRKHSIDSINLASFKEQSIVAMVHQSSDEMITSNENNEINGVNKEMTINYNDSIRTKGDEKINDRQPMEPSIDGTLMNNDTTILNKPMMVMTVSQQPSTAQQNPLNTISNQLETNYDNIDEEKLLPPPAQLTEDDIHKFASTRSQKFRERLNILLVPNQENHDTKKQPQTVKKEFNGDVKQTITNDHDIPTTDKNNTPSAKVEQQLNGNDKYLKKTPTDYINPSGTKGMAPPPPPQPLVIGDNETNLNNINQPQMAKQLNKKIDDTISSNIPPPPVFDAVLFKQLDQKHKTDRKLLPDQKTEIEEGLMTLRKKSQAKLNENRNIKSSNGNLNNVSIGDKSEQVNMEGDGIQNDKTRIVQSKSVEDEDEDIVQKRIGVRARLEKLLSRGPPQNRYSRTSLYSRTQSMTALDQNEDSGGSVSVQKTPTPKSPKQIIRQTGDNNNNVTSKRNGEPVSNSIIYDFKDTTRPFDTVHKQKLLFSNVLKSINPDTRPSIIKSNSMRQSITTDIKTNDIIQPEHNTPDIDANTKIKSGE